MMTKLVIKTQLFFQKKKMKINKYIFELKILKYKYKKKNEKL